MFSSQSQTLLLRCVMYLEGLVSFSLYRDTMFQLPLQFKLISQFVTFLLGQIQSHLLTLLRRLPDLIGNQFTLTHGFYRRLIAGNLSLFGFYSQALCGFKCFSQT